MPDREIVYCHDMTESSGTPVLAVDGGGTRCRVAVETGGDVLAVESGAANVSTDFDGALRQVMAGIERLAERLGRPVAALHDAPAFVGLAGITGPAIADRLRAALPFRHLRIADDRPAAVRGALGPRDGVVAHCGTGSFFAAQRGGAIRLAGGWGPVLGDEASAQWVGRLALGLTLRSVDGRVGPSPLASRLLSDFGDAAGIVRFAAAARPSDFGALAPLVTERAGSGDAIAESILRRGADEIARALCRIGHRPGGVVCLTGGIGPHYARYLGEDLRACLAEPQGEPLDGALSLAREFAGESAAGRR